MGFLRLALAMSVVLVHVWPHEGPPFLLGGELAVEVFFMISGFYMALVLSTRYEHATGSFWLARALRIYPTYWIVAIAVVALWAVAGDRFQILAHQSGTMQLLTAFTNTWIIGQDATLWLALAPDGVLHWTENFHDHAYPQPLHFLLIPQAWSLSLELVFYAMVPFFNRLSTRSICVLVALSLSARALAYNRIGLDYDPWTYRFYPFEISFFLLGMLAYRLYALRGIRLRAHWRQMAIVVAAAIVLFRFFPDVSIYRLSINNAVLFAIVFLAIPYLFSGTIESGLDRFVGDLSYPLYLTHLLASSFCALALGTRSATVIIAVSLLVSAGLVIYVERPLDRWRHRVTEGKRTPVLTGTAAE
jgi:peptidoglycan/LPS O-acetylase OafA/YrhL